MEEYIYLDNFYEKIGLKLANKGVEEISKEKEDTNNIFSILEKEIGKQLSPIEIEIVKGWKEASYSDDLIKEAIKEAVSNDAVSLRYIDKVLYNWNKDGVTTIEEVNKRRKNFKEAKSKDNKKELFEYNWLDDNE
jgi:DNA replication protein